VVVHLHSSANSGSHLIRNHDGMPLCAILASFGSDLSAFGQFYAVGDS